MTFTKVTNTGIGSTGTVLLQNLDVIGIATAGFGVSTVDVFTTGITTFANATDSTSSTTGSVIVSGGVGIAGSLNVGGSVSVGGTLTYEDVTNVDSVGIITARSNILVGSGITLSPDGHAFVAGVSTIGTLSVSGIATVGGVIDSSTGTVTSSGNMTVGGKLIISGNSAVKDIEYGDGTTAGYFRSNTNVNRANADAAIHLQQFRWNDTKVAEIKVLTGDDTTNKDNAEITFETASAGTTVERIRITDIGTILKGHTTASTNIHDAQTTTDREIVTQIHGTSTVSAAAALISWNSSTARFYGSALYLAKSGSDTVGTNAIVTSDSIGSIVFSGDDGDEFVKGARIEAEIDGTPGAGDMPTKLTFSTNSGSEQPTPRMSISAAGYITGSINTPAWFGRQDTTHNVGNQAWTTVINLGNNVINPSMNNGGWNESTGIFTVQSGQAGLYYVYGQAAIDDLMDNDVIRAGFSKNDGTVPLYSQQRCIDQGSNVVVNSGLVAQTVDLAVGDTIKLQVYHNEGNTNPTEAVYCFFGGYRLSS